MNLTDTHCHLDYHKFNDDREETIQRASASGLIRLLVPGLHHKSSKEAVALAEKHPSIYAAVGFHPTDLEEFNQKNFEKVKELARHPKVMAIGEIGIDYYWVKEKAQREFQRKALKQQLELAKQINKPAVIHMREENDAWSGAASVDLLRILEDWQKGLSGALAEKPGVLHSFNGTLETAQKALALNFYIGVTGPITYKNADKKREIVAQLPLEKLLIETDSPFLAPAPFRGKRNEPANVGLIADKIAEVHRTTREAVAQITTANANRLFGWEAYA